MTINVVRRTGLTERDWQEVERAYASASPYSYVALDDFFTHPLSLVFKENYSRIWADSTRTGKRTTFMSDPKIPEIESVANELKKRPPAVLDRLGLVRCRAFVHQRNAGLKVSSNNGAVTVDVWMTLDEYNVPNQSPCSSVTSESSRRRKAYDDDQGSRAR
jgi:hypothetical protein